MIEDYDKSGRWVTLKNGKHIFIDTSKYMNSFIKGKGYNNMMKKKGDDRFEQLKQMYPNAQVNELYGGYEEIVIHDQPLIDEYSTYSWETGEYNPNALERGYYKDVTQKMLNEMPVSFNTRWRSDYDYQDHESHYIYRNKADMMKAIKSFGGIEQMTDNGKIHYSIESQAGLGEYYLYRDKYTKGGWKWEDVNGDTVKGREQAEINKIRNKRFIEKYGQEEFDKYH